VNVGDVMSNDVQSHEGVDASAAAAERRGGVRHPAGTLGSVTARIIGGSPVDLVNFSSRGVLFECDSRLLIGARASVRITTPDANLMVSGRVVRSRVKGLVNGALRYDAALVLDSELALTPAILAAVPAATEDMIAFETDFEDPSPVEAYVAESEASLLEAVSTDLPIEDAMASLATVEPPPEPEPERAAADTAAADLTVFEADAEIAFEPSPEFVFDEPLELAGTLAVEPAAVEEPAGASMFDATYLPPVYESDPVSESQFEVTTPRPAPAQAVSSIFDSRPSTAYGEALAAEVAAPVALDTPAAVEVDFESEVVFVSEVAFEDVAFEAVDAALLETSVADVAVDAPEAGPATLEVAVSVTLEPLAPEAATIEMAEAAAPVADPVDEPIADTTDVPAPIDEPIEPAAAVSDTEDRVLLQFAATVPHDLADLRRIAADNQW
jgi:hypothetical protein